MGSNESLATVRLRLPYDDQDDFVSGYASLCRAGTLFLPTRKIQEVGTRVRFELLSREGARLMLGEGVVVEGTAPAGRTGFFLKVAGLDAAGKKVFVLLKEAAARQASAGTAKREGDRPLGAGGEDGAEASEDESAASGTREDPEAGEAPSDGERRDSDFGDAESAVIGIDFGTWSCRAAAVIEGAPRLIDLGEEGASIPSGAASGRGESLLVGTEALSRRSEQPDQAVFGVKRLLGRRLHSPWIRDHRQSLSHPLAAGEDGELMVPLARARPTVTEVAGRILQETRKRAEARLEKPCRRAVLALPAGFCDSSRKALREAARLAGIEVLRLISGPMAVAIAYGAGKGLAAKRVLVIDLGAGFLDVAVLTVSGDRFEVVGSGGEVLLGGMDIDARVEARLLAGLAEAGGPESPTPNMRQRLLAAAEEAKIALDESPMHRVLLPALWRDEMSGDAMDLDIELHREDLETWCRELVVDRAMGLTGRLLKEQGLEPGQMDDVLLVGCQARMPLIRRVVEETFGVAPRADVQEGAAALGSALLAHSIQAAADHTVPELVLKDVLTNPIAMGVSGGGLMTVVERGTRIPCERTIHLETSRDDQEMLEAVLFQGDSFAMDGSEYLGTMTFLDLPPRPAGKTVLRLRFAIDSEGLISTQGSDDETDEPRPHILSTSESPEDLAMRLASPATVIRELAEENGRSSPERGQAKESRGFFGGLKRLFGGRG